MFEEIKQLLIETANLDDIDITLESRLKEDLNFDSLYAVELILALEEHYDFHADTKEIEKLFTVADVCELVEKKLNEKEGK